MGCSAQPGDSHSRNDVSSWSPSHTGGSKAYPLHGQGEGPDSRERRQLGKRKLEQQLELPRTWLGREQRKRQERRRQTQGEGRPLEERKRQRASEGGVGCRAEGGREQGKVKGSAKESTAEKAARMLGGEPCSLAEIGILLWWLVEAGQGGKDSQTSEDFCPSLKRLLARVSSGLRVTRARRALFPLPNFWAAEVEKFYRCSKFEEVVELCESSPKSGTWMWCILSAKFCNRLHDGSWRWANNGETKPQQAIRMQIEKGVTRLIEYDTCIELPDSEIRNDLRKKLLSYTGEEIAMPEKLTLEQVIPGLPPEEHGGRIPVTDWIGGKCRSYVEDPGACLVEDVGQTLPKLQARVHVNPEDKLALGKLLVERRICRWVKDESVITFRGEQVLNGMFGVPKSKLLPDNRCVLRLIMNLIPSNAIHKSVGGRVHELPHITRWVNVVLEEDEILHVCQCDMQAAFYLFSLPPSWSSHLCFNLKARGSEIGFHGAEANALFTLGCAVLPMGWSSAVGVMQFIAEEVLHRNGMPQESQLRKSNPLPAWMVSTLAESSATGKMWWHVYLDNYASGERVLKDEPMAGEWLQKVEHWWEEAGIVSSREKAVRNATEATELGAFLGGKGQWIGASVERLVKVLRNTWWLVRQEKLSKKLLQVILGRWVFILQFRRPGMATFEAVWEVISGKRHGIKAELEAKEELLSAMLGVCLFHTFLGNRIDNEITCSDASNVGGAVAVAQDLTDFGKGYLLSQEPTALPLRVPVVLISLFNGVGACFRCHDLAGVQVVGAISADIHGPANRVTSRRWPWVVILGDVKELTKHRLEELIEEMPHHVAIHLWMGFPCVDLSSAKAGRKNLQGTESSLVFEGRRILEELRMLYPNKEVKFIVENVASMDNSAREALTEMFQVIPYRLDPSDQVPMSRPRYCWTDVEIPETNELWHIKKEGYVELRVERCWPEAVTWLEEGAWQNDPQAIYPTCMKSIRRIKPPPRPAGLERCSEEAKLRWAAHEFRFPPYQYKEQYLIYDEKKERYRLLSVLERERLMGLGAHHTSVCWSASKAKQDVRGFEDERLSLIGDSFACSSFMVVAAAAVFPWSRTFDISQMNQRLGLPPGASSRLCCPCPLNTTQSYGNFSGDSKTVKCLNTHMAQRANHTGSDVKLLTGQLMNPRQLARQSVASAWWQWKHVFRVRWEVEQHINPLECRAIYLPQFGLEGSTLCTGRKKSFSLDGQLCVSEHSH